MIGKNRQFTIVSFSPEIVIRFLSRFGREKKVHFWFLSLVVKEKKNAAFCWDRSGMQNASAEM